MVEVQNSEDSRDPLKWMIAVGLFVAGVYGYYYFDSYLFVYRLLAMIPVIIISGFCVSKTTQGNSGLRLIKDAILEAKRVVWPTRQETTQTTLVVVAVVFAAGLILWLLDVLLNWLTSMVMV